MIWPRIPRILIRMVPLVVGASPGWLVISIITRIIQALVPGIQIYVTSHLVDAATRLFVGSTTFTHVIMLLALQTALLLINSALRSADGLIMFRFQQKLNFTFDERIIRKAISLPLSFFDQSTSYDSLQRASSGQNGAELIQILLQISQYLLTIVTYIVILTSFHWWLAIVLIVMVIPGLWVNMRFGGLRFKQMRRQTSTARREQYFIRLLTGKEAAKEIRVFELGQHLNDLWKQSYWKNIEEQYKLEKRYFTFSQILNSLQALMTASILTILLWFGSLGRLTIGNYVALGQAVQQTQTLLQSIATLLSRVYQNALFAGELLEFLSTPEHTSTSQSVRINDHLQKGIQVKNLHFTYPGTSRLVLKNVNFEIIPGQKIAIVGENGSGKTTLIKCLIGLYLEYNGTITYDGIPIKNIDAQQLRQKVTAIFQDFVCYQLSLRDNIGFGQIDNLDDLVSIELAAAKSGVDKFLNTLSQGYESQIGPTFAGGRDLSYGQWQRIAISRAFFRDAEVVILDEPTAALDPLAEAAIFEQFAQLTKGKTSIFISHRLGSCRHVDHILVMKEGILVEQGSHEELIALHGEYGRMYNLQAKWYM